MILFCVFCWMLLKLVLFCWSLKVKCYKRLSRIMWTMQRTPDPGSVRYRRHCEDGCIWILTRYKWGDINAVSDFTMNWIYWKQLISDDVLLMRNIMWFINIVNWSELLWKSIKSREMFLDLQKMWSNVSVSYWRQSSDVISSKSRT